MNVAVCSVCRVKLRFRTEHTWRSKYSQTFRRVLTTEKYYRSVTLRSKFLNPVGYFIYHLVKHLKILHYFYKLNVVFV
jgi:hypothetical protein